MQGYGLRETAEPVECEHLEEVLQLVEIFTLLGRLYQVSPLLPDDALRDACIVLRAANNQAKYERPLTQIVTNDMVQRVAALTGSSKELCHSCAAATLLPSKRLHLLEFLRQAVEERPGI